MNQQKKASLLIVNAGGYLGDNILRNENSLQANEIEPLQPNGIPFDEEEIQENQNHDYLKELDDNGILPTTDIYVALKNDSEVTQRKSKQLEDEEIEPLLPPGVEICNGCD